MRRNEAERRRDFDDLFADFSPDIVAYCRWRAWNVAEQLGWAETYDAEYVALTQLQADAFVTLDAELSRKVKEIVTTATIEALRTT